MAIVITDGFQINTTKPVDNRLTVADITARNAIGSGVRYQGLQCFVVSDTKTYVLKTGITNGDWVELGALATSNLSVDTFNGTGAQTVYTLISDPGSKNNTLVTVDGVVQLKASYTITAATTLTFSTAPPTGTGNIEVAYGSALNAGTPADGSVTTIKLADGSVTTAKIADANVTKAKLAALGQQISSSSGNFQTGSTSDIAITNLSVSITTTGRPVFIGLKTDSTTGGLLGVGGSGSTGNVTANIKIRRGGTVISAQKIIHVIPTAGSPMAIYVPISSINTIDTPAAGTYTYDVYVICSGTNVNFEIDSAKLVVFEL